MDRAFPLSRTQVKGVEGVDITRGEAVEADLPRLIQKRHDHRVVEEGHRPSE